MTDNTSLVRKALVAALLLFILFGTATILANFTLVYASGWINEDSFAQKNFILKAYLLLFTGLAMLIGKKYAGLNYGFEKGTNLNYFLYLKRALVYGLLGLLFVILFNIIGLIITRQKPVAFPSERLIDRILFIWIWSSVVEEILFRGLLQSYLSNNRLPAFTIRKASISPAVFITALYFAVLHMVLWLQGMSLSFALGIVVHTFILGLLTGYYREKTGSIWPGMLIHVLFNIVGSLPLLLQHQSRPV